MKHVSLKGAVIGCLAAVSLTVAPAFAEEIHQGLISYWPLDEIVGGVGTPDVAKGNDLLLSGMDASNLVAGKFGQAMSFDGIEEYLWIQHDGTNALPVAHRPFFTVSVWVKGDGSAQQDRRVFSESSTQQRNTLFNIGTDNNGDGNLRTDAISIYMRNDDGGIPIDHLNTQGHAFDDTWHHIAWVASEGYGRFYIDGVLDPVEYNFNLLPFSGEILSLGAIVRVGDPVATNFFAGLIDEVAVWDRALSEAEVQSLAAGVIPLPVVVYPPTISAQPVGTTLRVGESYTLSVFASGQEPFTYQWKQDGVDIPGATDRQFQLVNVTVDDSGFYSVVVTNPDGTIESEAARILVPADPEPNLAEGLVSYWPFDEATDQEGVWMSPDLYSGNDMKLVNMTDLNLVDSPNGKALSLDGEPQYAQRVGGFPISGNEIYSISFWVRADGIGQSDRRIFSEASGFSNTPLFNFGTTTNGDGESLKVFIRNDDNTSPLNRVTTTPVLDNEWHHVVWVDEGGVVKLYVDGALDATDFSYTQGLRTMELTAVGAILRAAPSHWFIGEVDEVAVWNRRLSYTDVQEIKTAGLEPPPAPIPPSIPVQPVGGTVWEGIDFVLTAQAVGTNPISYQWSKDGTPIPGATLPTLVLYEVTPAQSGIYTVEATNNAGAATSEPAELVVRDIKDVTTGMIAYWPFEEVGETTPDLIYGNDLTLVNMGPENQVPGRFGQAISLDGVAEHLEALHTEETVGLPVYPHPEFTVAFWVKGSYEGQSDRRVFSESSTLSTSQLFNISTDNNGATGAVDIYVRNDDGAAPVDHRDTPGVAFDGEWHHVAFTDSNGDVSIYIDGVLDDSFSYQRGVLTPNATAIGAIRRATTGYWFGGVVDEVMAWERILSTKELAHIIANGPVPQATGLEITGLTRLGNGDLQLTIQTEAPGEAHQIQEASTPDAAAWNDVVGASITGPEGNLLTATVPAPTASERFYRAIRFAAPPAFLDDFESGNQGWTHGGTEDNWELGTPTTGPGAARSGLNVWATGLSTPYELGQNNWLRSPAIDLAGLTSPILTFWEYRDVEPLFLGTTLVDYTTLNVLDAANPNGDPLAVLIANDTGTTPQWTKREFVLPAGVAGKSIILEFILTADSWQEVPQYGWYIDDVTIE